MPTWVNKFIKWAGTVGSSAVAAGLVAAGTTYYFNDLQDSRSKERAAYYEQAQKLRDRQNDALDKFFSENDDRIAVASKEYIDNVLAKKPLKKSADELESQIFKKIRQAETLKSIFAPDDITKELEQYQNALQEFADSIEGFKTPLQMKIWSEDFAKVKVASDKLQRVLRKAADKPVGKSSI